MAYFKMSWKNKILFPSITKCLQEMTQHDFGSFGASDEKHFHHLYWACILGAFLSLVILSSTCSAVALRNPSSFSV